MTNLVLFKPDNIPAALRANGDARAMTELGGGISAGFPVLSIRGSKWRIKYRGEDQVLKTKDGFISTLPVVILRANGHLSKMYYAGQYVQGSDDPPTCMSSDGVKPDAGVEEQQAALCATCPHNAWGSRVVEGKKLKACADTKRIAVVLAGDIHTQKLGPMLLRVPAASLQSLQMLASQMTQAGVQYWGVVVKMTFDDDASYPKIVFEADSMVGEKDIPPLESMRESEVVNRILGPAMELIVPEAPTPTPENDEPPVVDVTAESVTPAPTQKRGRGRPKKTEKVTPIEPPPTETVDTQKVEDDVTAQLSEMVAAAGTATEEQTAEAAEETGDLVTDPEVFSILDQLTASPKQ